MKPESFAVGLRPRHVWAPDDHLLVPLPPGVPPDSQLAKDMICGFMDYLLQECCDGRDGRAGLLEALRRWQDLGTRYRYAEEAEDYRLSRAKRDERSRKSRAAKAREERKRGGKPPGSPTAWEIRRVKAAAADDGGGKRTRRQIEKDTGVRREKIPKILGPAKRPARTKV